MRHACHGDALPHSLHSLTTSPIHLPAVSTPMADNHYRMRLNNLLQATRGAQALRWDTKQAGPEHTTPWTAVALIQGVEWGRGVHQSLATAKEIAAWQAYRALHRETYGIDPPQ